MSQGRLRLHAGLIVGSLVGVLLLPSQSAASWPVYLLGLSMLISWRQWRGALRLPLVRLLACFLGYLVVSACWSDVSSGRELFAVLTRVLQTLLFVLAAAECVRHGLLHASLGRILAPAGALAALLALVGFFPEAAGRLAGVGQLDNHVVAGLTFGAVLLLLAWAWLHERAPLWRWGYVLAATLIVPVIFLTQSRNGWAATGLGLLALLAIQFHRKRPGTVLAVVGAGSLCCILALALFVFGDPDGALRSALFPRGDSHRFAIWQAVVGGVIPHDLWFGQGILTDLSVRTVSGEFPHPHSMYLTIIYQGGLIGFGLFIALIGLLLCSGIRLMRQPECGLALASLALILSSWLLDGYDLLDKVGLNWFLFWLPLATVTGLCWRAEGPAPARLARPSRA